MSISDHDHSSSSKYPCGTCDCTVTWEDRGVACENCGQWFHAKCQSIGSMSYKNLDDSNISWRCVICDKANHSNISFDLFDIESERANFTKASTNQTVSSPESINFSTFHPNHASTPTRASKQNKLKRRPLRLVNVNFQSVKEKKADITNMVDSVQPDIIIGTESHLEPNISDAEFLPPNYKAHRKDRNKYGGGVFIALKEDLFLNSQRMPELETDCEIVWIRLKASKSIDTFICAYYRPHTSDIDSYDKFETSVTRACGKENSKLIIAGDLNFPDWNWSDMTLKKSNYPTLHRKFQDFLHDRGLDQLVQEPTRNENTLDLVMTNSPHLVPRIETIPGISDHDIVYFEYNMSQLKNTQKPRPISIYKKANWQNMKQSFMQESLEIKKLFTQNADPEEMWQHFKKTYDDTVKEHIPTKILKKKISHPWISIELKKLMKKRDRKYRKLKKCKTKTLDDEVKSLKREIRKKIRREHWDHVHSLFITKEDEAPSEREKRLFSYMKTQKKTNFGIPPLKENGILITDPKEKAEVLNREFDLAFSDGKVYTTDNIKKKCHMPKYEHLSMPDIKIKTEGVEKLLKTLNPSKAPGPDGMAPKVLKTLAEEIAPSLSLIFQRSYYSGKVPSDWKLAHVTPVYKKGEHYRASNYRPISLTSIPCKIMEHILVSNLTNHLEGNKLLTKSQHGFRAKHSCESQLIQLTNELSQNLDDGIQTDLIVLDFAKAFDKVNHSLLTHKLASYGVRGKTNRWIQDFLTDRHQAVIVDGTKSSNIHVRSGVPQGSVLGPCLFLVYINDLPNRVKSNARLFADDTAIDRKIRSPEDVKTLQSDLDALAVWESEWDMSFHPNKCSVLHVSRSKVKKHNEYFLHGHRLECVSSTRYLGVTLQDDGEFDKHIREVANSGSQMLGFVRRNLKINSKNVKEQAYKMLVRPKMEYASSVWDPFKLEPKTELEKVQRRAARVVTNRHRNTSSVSDMLADLKWPSLEKRRKHARLVLLYKTLEGSVEIDCEIKQSTSRSRRTTAAHSRQLDRCICKRDIRLNAFLPRTIRDWNSLPDHVVLAPNADSFRLELSRLG